MNVFADVPNPDGAITKDDFEARQRPTPPEPFAIDATRKFIRRLDRPAIGSGTFIPNRRILGVHPQRGEDAAELHFANV